MNLLMEWLVQSEYIKSQNELVTKHCHELQSKLSSQGFKSCLLKGQSLSSYYGDFSLYRKFGDIADTVKRVCQIGISVDNINIKHADAKFFEDTEVEIHFIPSWFYNPASNRIFKEWVDRMKSK